MHVYSALFKLFTPFFLFVVVFISYCLLHEPRKSRIIISFSFSRVLLLAPSYAKILFSHSLNFILLQSGGSRPNLGSTETVEKHEATKVKTLKISDLKNQFFWLISF